MKLRKKHRGNCKSCVQSIYFFQTQFLIISLSAQTFMYFPLKMLINSLSQALLKASFVRKATKKIFILMAMPLREGVKGLP